MKKLLVLMLTVVMILSFGLIANAAEAENTTTVAIVNGTDYDTFTDAVAAAKALTGDVVIEIYDKVTLNVNLDGSYDKLTFVGKTETAEIYLEVQGYITATGKSLAFEDLILSKSVGGHIVNAGFMNVAFGVYQVKEVVYTNCTFANGACASAGDVTFTDCTFYHSHDKYGLWALGDVNVTVDSCVFDDYRGIKMYAEGGIKATELTVKDTDFSALTGKPAIVLTYGESVTLEGGNKYSSTGTFELDLDGAPNGTAISVAESENVTCTNDNGACGVIVDGKIYTTVAQAAEVATNGSKVTLLHNTTETVELPEGTTLDTNGYTAENVTVVATAPTGTLTNVYTSASGYWGKCGGNAKESFGFKFYNGNTYMGSTFLNNIGGIIDGDVYVSWSLMLNAEANTDEYWDMSWEIAPTIAMQPTRVEQYVDGVKVAEAIVEPNWSDAIFKVVAAVTDENGKILSYVNNTAGATLQDAIEAVQEGEIIVLLSDITVEDTITIPAGAVLTLDLNGKIISQTKAQTGNYQMILNDGNLTIKSSVEGGKISYADTLGGNFISNTITNRGTLTLESGRIENISSQAVADVGFPYAIDTSIWGSASEVVINIKGGEVCCESYSAIRLRADSETKAVNVNISGGEVYGRIEVQNPTSNKATVGKLTISDNAYINKNNSSMAIMIFGGGGTAENLKVAITDGTVVGKISYSSYFPIENFDENVITGGTFTTDVNEFCAEGYEVVENGDGTYSVAEAKNYVAEVNGVKFETVADALAYAKEQGITDLVITLIGETTKESAIALEDTFDLYLEEAFNSITFKQADKSVPYYISCIYTGKRLNNGTFVFDGVNIVVTDQYIFEGNVKLINNSTVKSISESNCFHYYSTTTVEAGSVLAGVIDDFRGGDLIIDGGLTDGSFSVTPSFQDAILAINWAGSSLTIKNGAYVNINASDEIGRVTINADASLNVYGSKLESVEYIINNGAINIDINSTIKTGKITGAGVINIDINGLTGSALVIDADMSEFTGTINLVGTGAASYEITDDGLVVKAAENVAEVNGVKYATLAEAVEALKANGGTLKLLSDVGGSITLNSPIAGNPTEVTIDLNGYAITSDESTLWVSDGYVVTVTDSVGTGKIVTISNGDEAIAIARGGKVILEGGTVEGVGYGVYLYARNATGNEEFVVNGGTVTVPNGGTVIAIGSGKVTVNGGKVLCNNVPNGGGWNSYIYENGTMIITGGEFLGTIGNYGTIAIKGGTFSYCDDVNDGFNNEHLAAGYTAQTNDDGSITVVKLPSAAKIGDVEYSTIEEALRAVKNGETIVLIANCTMAEVVELRDIAITIEGEYTLTLNDNLKVFGETTLNIKSAIEGDVWLDDGTILKDSYINGDVFVAGNVTFRGENSVNMLYDFGVLESNYGTSAPMAWTVEKGASLEIRNKARYGLGYGDKVTIFGSIEDALTARESLTDGDVAFFVHGLVAQENSGWNKNNYFTVEDAYVVIGSNNSFGNKPGNYGGNYSFIFNNTVLDASRITFYEATSKTELSFTNCDVVTGTFMTRDKDSAFILANTKLLSTTTSNGSDEGNYNEGIITLINSILTYSAQLTNNGTIKLDVNSCLTAPSIVGTGKIIIDATGLTADKIVINADMSGFTGTIEVIGAASHEITDDGVVVAVKKITLEDIFTFKGYSTNSDKTGIAAGFTVDFVALKEYERQNGVKLVFGSIFTAEDINNPSLTADLTSYDAVNINLMITGIDITSDRHMSANFIMALYVDNGEEMSYVTKGGIGNEDTVATVRYNDIVALAPSTSKEDE